MDRLARNLEDLRRLMRTPTGKGVRVFSIRHGEPDFHLRGHRDGDSAAVGDGRVR
jgi:DNA invertase Pin-like site-specific DNA recombinase